MYLFHCRPLYFYLPPIWYLHKQNMSYNLIAWQGWGSCVVVSILNSLFGSSTLYLWFWKCSHIFGMVFLFLVWEWRSWNVERGHAPHPLLRFSQNARRPCWNRVVQSRFVGESIDPWCAPSVDDYVLRQQLVNVGGTRPHRHKPRVTIGRLRWPVGRSNSSRR